LIQKTTILSGTYTVYIYDGRNRLVEVYTATSGGTVTQVEKYIYDGLDRRVAVVSLTSTTATAYNGTTPYADFNGSGTATLYYLDGDNPGEVLGNEAPSNGATIWYIRDYEGSVLLDVANNGGVADHVIYDPFGAISYDLIPANGDRFKYAWGQYSFVASTGANTSTGIYSLGERYYDPAQHRWLSPDPIGFAGGDPNLYRYVGNDPTTFVDPSGLLDEPPGGWESPRWEWAKGLVGGFFSGLYHVGKGAVTGLAMGAHDLVAAPIDIEFKTCSFYPLRSRRSQWRATARTLRIQWRTEYPRSVD
jgi:RHS repeat-associated protein